jgi:serine/threonine protein kinase
MRGGAYRILEPLGKGGMGALYLAADTGAFGRKCVVKELLDYYDPADAVEARRAQARFETEARLLAELSHPGIPRIYSYFSEAGRHYIVMEYIEGETLERAVTHTDPSGSTVAARPLPSEEAVRHAIRVCEVLEYLAGQPMPIVHHDIKPANLIVERISSQVRLVDFGTAQTRLWRTRAQSEERGTSLFGTEGYAAPEQYQGRSEPRSDVYALASTLYHVLTDDDPMEHPFRFPQMGTLPGPLADALDRALRPEARRRSTATEFRQALEAWLVPEDGGQPFVFRSGAVARTTEGLVNLCDRYWDQARQHLVNGDFDNWFRARNRHDLVAKARSARLEGDPDAALELFLRRLNSRLRPPHLSVEPQAIDFGRVARHVAGSGRQVTVRNETRGYGQATLSASVPWISFDPDQVGCLVGAAARVAVSIDGGLLPFRREHQALVTITPVRGAPISIPVTAKLSLSREAFHWAVLQLRILGMWLARGARWGWSLWRSALRSLVRSRYGLWVLLGEMLLLDAAMILLWQFWRDGPLDMFGVVMVYFRLLPFAMLAAFLLPPLVLAGVGALREAVRAWMGRA